MKTIRDIDIKNKRVLTRVDFNIAFNNDGHCQDDFRIKAVLPTIKYLLKKKAKIILMSHLGRPQGKVVESLRLNSVQERLSCYLKKEIKKADACVGLIARGLAESLKSGEILLLENLRFNAGEENNDENFARDLASLGEVYVNDAFGVCHREHASVAAITKFLPSVAGLLLEKEVSILSRVLLRPQKPLVVIIGGVKISTKIKVIEKFLNKADNIILGGALANTVLYSQGIAVGKSIIETELIPRVKELKITNTKLHIPVDVIVSFDKSGQMPARVAPVGKTKEEEIILDIGPDTETLFARVIKNAKTIIWNGPMGFFEIKAFAHGSQAMARAVASARAFSVIGGGETIVVIKELNLMKKFNHISTGGGAMLAFLAGEKLPGLVALQNLQSPTL